MQRLESHGRIHRGITGLVFGKGSSEIRAMPDTSILLWHLFFVAPLFSAPEAVCLLAAALGKGLTIQNDCRCEDKA